MKIIPITYWTTVDDLSRKSVETASRKLFIGLPFKMMDEANILSRNYVVLSLEKFFNPHLRREARHLNRHVVTTVLGNSDRNAGWFELLDDPQIRNLRQNPRMRDMWSYMIIDAVLRERPTEYLKGEQHIADFFAERLQISFGYTLRPPLIRETFHRHLLDRANIEASLDLKMELAYRQQEIIDHMDEMQRLGQGYMDAMMLLMGLACGVTEIILLDVVLQAFIGYVQFAYDLKKAESDGMISDDEAFGSWFSLVGVFLPFTHYLPGMAKTLVEAGLGVVAVAAIILEIVISLLRAAVGLLEAVAADSAGFDGYAQYDPENTIFIPA